jgi:hypothetical protein
MVFPMATVRWERRSIIDLLFRNAEFLDLEFRLGEGQVGIHGDSGAFLARSVGAMGVLTDDVGGGDVLVPASFVSLVSEGQSITFDFGLSHQFKSGIELKLYFFEIGVRQVVDVGEDG